MGRSPGIFEEFDWTIKEDMMATTSETSVIDLAYKSLYDILGDAFLQACDGKGKERHAKPSEPFEKQKICEITRRVGLGYPLGQAIKKAEESLRLQPEAGVQELLGAINYLAAAIIVMREIPEDIRRELSDDQDHQ